MSKRIVLGSGKLYVSAYNKDSGIPEEDYLPADQFFLSGSVSGSIQQAWLQHSWSCL